MGSLRTPVLINLCAGDRLFAGWQATDINPAGPSIEKVDATQLPYENESVDVVMMSHGLTALDLLENGWRRCFDEVFRVLRPGGCFRIDDAPLRWYIMVHGEPQIDPVFLRPKHRSLLFETLCDAGFNCYAVPDSSVTNIPALMDARSLFPKTSIHQLCQGLIDNRTWHESFTIECHKAVMK